MPLEIAREVKREIISDIKGIPKGYRLAFWFLVLAVIFLWSRLIMGNNKDSKTQDKIDESNNRQLEEMKAEVRSWKYEAHIKDSLYNDCSTNRFLDAKETINAQKRRNILTDSTITVIHKK